MEHERDHVPDRCARVGVVPRPADGAHRSPSGREVADERRGRGDQHEPDGAAAIATPAPCRETQEPEAGRRLHEQAEPDNEPGGRPSAARRERRGAEHREPDPCVVVAVVHHREHEHRMQPEERERADAARDAPQQSERSRGRQRGQPLEREAGAQRGIARRAHQRRRPAGEQRSVHRPGVLPARADPTGEGVVREVGRRVRVRAHVMRTHDAAVLGVRPQIVRLARRHRDGDEQHDRDRADDQGRARLDALVPRRDRPRRGGEEHEREAGPPEQVRAAQQHRSLGPHGDAERRGDGNGGGSFAHGAHVTRRAAEIRPGRPA